MGKLAVFFFLICISLFLLVPNVVNPDRLDFLNVITGDYYISRTTNIDLFAGTTTFSDTKHTFQSDFLYNGSITIREDIEYLPATIIENPIYFSIQSTSQTSYYNYKIYNETLATPVVWHLKGLVNTTPTNIYNRTITHIYLHSMLSYPFESIVGKTVRLDNGEISTATYDYIYSEQPNSSKLIKVIQYIIAEWNVETTEETLELDLGLFDTYKLNFTSGSPRSNRTSYYADGHTEFLSFGSSTGWDAYWISKYYNIVLLHCKGSLSYSDTTCEDQLYQSNFIKNNSELLTTTAPPLTTNSIDTVTSALSSIITESTSKTFSNSVITSGGFFVYSVITSIFVIVLFKIFVRKR